MGLGDRKWAAWHKSAGAEISLDGRFRYLLWRSHLAEDAAVPPRRCVFVMLNPSTADHELDDPTITKCIAYTSLWGFDRLEVVNLYAYRTKSPEELRDQGFQVGPRNDEMIALAVQRASRVVLAWGKHAQVHRAAEVRHLIRKRMAFPSTAPVGARDVVALKRNGDGSPIHPLYQPLDAAVILA